MDTTAWIEASTAICTAGLAAATFWLAWLTRKLEKAWFRTSSEQLGVNTWLELERRFDSDAMKRTRRKLATQPQSYDPGKHDRISETVLNFFEDVGTTYKLGYLNKQLADSAFGFYACRWWEAAKPYVDREQKRHGEDKTPFDDFRRVAEELRLPNERIDLEEVQRFLDDERRLVTD